jgi:hypothetical protein
MYTTLLWLDHFKYLWLKTYAWCEKYILPISIFASHWLKFTICISTSRCYCICISTSIGAICISLNSRLIVSLREIKLTVSKQFVQNWINSNLFACQKLNWRYLVGLSKIDLTESCWLVWNWIVGILSACIKLNWR